MPNVILWCPGVNRRVEPNFSTHKAVLLRFVVVFAEKPVSLPHFRQNARTTSGARRIFDKNLNLPVWNRDEMNCYGFLWISSTMTTYFLVCQLCGSQRLWGRPYGFLTINATYPLWILMIRTCLDSSSNWPQRHVNLVTIRPETSEIQRFRFSTWRT